MMYLFKDNGKPCAAKTWFALTMMVFYGDVAYSRVIGGAVDFSGWAIALGVVAGLYGWRAKTKEDSK